jgi:alpha-L-fucosidase
MRVSLRLPYWKMAVLAMTATCLSGQTAAQKNDRLDWWREARFGMFIHWGLYSVPAGEWKGKQIPGIGEWIMNRAKIPVADYEKLAKQFNPTKFNADEWVRVAKNAGQKYMVITTKHHDGFAMFHSKVSKYNIYDATPFKRDPIKELSEACKRQGMRLGFYYSQTQDWHEPNGDGNTWDFDESKKDFGKYFREKAIPQVRELLTNYGPVAEIWFDTPKGITPEESRALVELVHKLQPNCLVDGRIGNDMGDYHSTRDNEIPVKVLDYDWETPVTLNDTWGFKKSDNNWKDPRTLIRQLVDVVSKNGNYLLNVGPTSEGVIPQPSVERLAEVGKWLKVNGEAVYGAKPNPFGYEFDWGSITSKPGRMYLHIVEWPKDGSFTLYGLKSKVGKAYALASHNTPIGVTQANRNGHDELVLKVPATAPDAADSVIALEISGMPQVDRSLTQQPDGTVTLSSAFANVSGTKLNIDNRGIATNWLSTDSKMDWDFKLWRPGAYDVVLLTSEVRGGGGWDQAKWSGGHDVKVTVGGQNAEKSITDDGKVMDPRNPHFREVRSVVGRVSIGKPGAQHLTVQALKINPDGKLGFRLREVKLVPAGSR